MAKLIYLCSPYRGDVKYNTQMAMLIGREIAMRGMVPVIPHLYLPMLLNDDDEHERDLGLDAALVLLGHCDEMWVYDDNRSPTDGMAQELAEASTRYMPIKRVSVRGAVVVVPEDE